MDRKIAHVIKNQINLHPLFKNQHKIDFLKTRLFFTVFYCLIKHPV